MNRPQCGLRAALTDERRARRKSPIDPTKLQWEFVAPPGTASKEAVFLLPTEIFGVRKRALSACFLKAIRIRRYPLASRQPFPSSALAAFSPRLPPPIRPASLPIILRANGDADCTAAAGQKWKTPDAAPAFSIWKGNNEEGEEKRKILTFACGGGEERRCGVKADGLINLYMGYYNPGM